MNLVCLDLEGVLVPEIWIAFAEASGIPYSELLDDLIAHCEIQSLRSTSAGLQAARVALRSSSALASPHGWSRMRSCPWSRSLSRSATATSRPRARLGMCASP